MATYSRRTVLLSASVGISAGLAGCSDSPDRTDGPTTGSLGFANLDDLPHTIGVEVTGASDPLPAQQRDLTAMISLRPDETLLVRDVFTESTTYELAFTVDSDPPAREPTRTMSFTPFSGDESYVSLEISDEGTFTWNDVAAGRDSHY